MGQFNSIPNMSKNDLRDEIRKEYANVALDPHKGYHFHTGRDSLGIIGYDKSLLEGLPEATIASFAGTGNPFMLGPINKGEIVVDIGSGSGLDALIASKLVGPGGRVIGIDMTPEMLSKAQAGVKEMGAANVEFRKGLVEDLPLPDNFADVAISNGVLNLTLNKVDTLREWARILKPGGRLYIGDILVSKTVPESAMDDISMWTGWIAGGLPGAELLSAVSASGFENAEIVQKHNIFEGVPNPSSALDFGTQGVSLRANKHG